MSNYQKPITVTWHDKSRGPDLEDVPNQPAPKMYTSAGMVQRPPWKVKS